MNIKSAKISDLIQVLENAKLINGDLPVVMSADEEGNSYGTLNASYSLNIGGGFLILYPWEDGLRLEQIEGFKEE